MLGASCCLVYALNYQFLWASGYFRISVLLIFTKALLIEKNGCTLQKQNAVLFHEPGPLY